MGTITKGRFAAPALIAAAEERDELRNRLVEMEQSYVQVRNGNTALRDDNAAQRALLVRAGEALASLVCDIAKENRKRAIVKGLAAIAAIDAIGAKP